MASSDSTAFLDRVRRATVRIATQDRGDGQGVLIPGGYVLTAAHCVDWDHEGGMVLGDCFIQTITAADGKTYKVSPRAVEPCYDIAILSNVDGQQLFDECMEFEEFYEVTEPVEVMFDPMPMEEPQDVFVLSHRGVWISGKAIQNRRPEFASFCLIHDEPIESGTSGGPVVTGDGRLLGIVSNDHLAPRITALPYWAVEEVRNG